MITLIPGPNERHNEILNSAWVAHGLCPSVIASRQLAADNAHSYRVGPSALHGQGCFAVGVIPKGTILMDISGDFAEFSEETNQLQCVVRVQSKQHHQLRKVDGGIKLLGDPFFINHSCRPCFVNVMYSMDYMYVDDEQDDGTFLKHYMPNMSVIALDDIPDGSELLVDYFTTRSRRGVPKSTPGAVPCRCSNGRCPKKCYLMGP
jgi:hypothetical protein